MLKLPLKFSTAVVDRMIWVDKSEIPNINTLRGLLTVYPRYADLDSIKTYLETEKLFGIPRGIEVQADKVLYNFVKGTSIPLEFKGELRQHQEEIIKQWLYLYEDKKKWQWIINTDPGTGKTVMALWIASYLKCTTLVVVHRTDLILQWKERIVQFTNTSYDDIGEIIQNKCDFQGKWICIGMINSLAKIRSNPYPSDFYKYFGLVIFDEGHLLGATTFSRVTSQFYAKHRLLLSATINRDDGRDKVYFYHLGDNILHLRANYQPVPKVIIYTYPKSSGKIPHWAKDGKQVKSSLTTNLASNKERNVIIAKIIHKLAKRGYRVLVVSDRIFQLEELKLLLETEYWMSDVGLYVGHTPIFKRKWIAEHAKVILATTKIFKEGIDIPTLRALVFATPMRNIDQVVGRIRRSNPTLPDPIVVDIYDSAYGSITKRWLENRMRYYLANNCKIVQIKTI